MNTEVDIQKVKNGILSFLDAPTPSSRKESNP